MRRQLVGIGVLVLASASLVFIVTRSSTDVGMRANATAVATFDDARIAKICDRSNPNESMGMSRPTVIDRMDGVDAVIYATKTHFSTCIVVGPEGSDQSDPTLTRHLTKGVAEVESFGTLNKVHGRALYTTDTWFVVKVSPTVSTVKAVTRGFSHVSKIGDGFAFIHEKEAADLDGKFIYGVAAGFDAGGGVVGSTPLT